MLEEKIGASEKMGASKDLEEKIPSDSKGNLSKFITEATKYDLSEQVYLNGEFLAVIYTHPYRKYGEIEKTNKKCKLWVIYVDLSAYREACGEL